MKLAVIADDLTGANDSGVQLARHGIETAVLFDIDKSSVCHYQAVVYDTDSRSDDSSDAYAKVAGIARSFVELGFDTIFKKIDSTLRGNIGVEIDALYDVLQPEFVMIAPGYPQNNRTILQSRLYLLGIPADRSDFGNDPKTPVISSYLPELLRYQTSRAIGTITMDDLTQGEAHVRHKIAQFFKSGIPYLVIDSTSDHHLQSILAFTKSLPYRFVWVGSAGLANYLPAHLNMSAKKGRPVMPANSGPVLAVIGSINKRSRAQMKSLLAESDIGAIPFDSHRAVSHPAERDREIQKIYEEARRLASNGQDVVIYSMGEEADVERARKTGEANGFRFTEISNEIVKALGIVCAGLLDNKYFTGVILTGGDTARQVCARMGIKGLEPLSELEAGVPVSKLLGREHFYAITKAGGFGSDNVFRRAIDKLKGAGEL